MTGICSAHQGHDPACRLCVLSQNHQLQAQLKAADELAAALAAMRFNICYDNTTRPKRMWDAHANYLRLRESGKAQPTCTCGVGFDMQHAKTCDLVTAGVIAQPAIPQGEGAQEPTICQAVVKSGHDAILGDYEIKCGAPMPCAAHHRGEKA